MPRAALWAVWVRDAVAGFALRAVGRQALAGLKTMAKVRWKATVEDERDRCAERVVWRTWPGGCSRKMKFVIA